jgi:hypothetical protein
MNIAQVIHVERNAAPVIFTVFHEWTFMNFKKGIFPPPSSRVSRPLLYFR